MEITNLVKTTKQFVVAKVAENIGFSLKLNLKFMFNMVLQN